MCVRDGRGDALRVVVSIGKGVRGCMWSNDNKTYNVSTVQAKYVVANTM